MEKGFMLSILRDLINSYLSSVIDKDKMYFQLIEKISPSDVVGYEDELLNDSYFAIYHMNEKFCTVSNDEFAYLRDCLDGKHKFSRVERDRIIRKDSDRS